MAARSSAKTPLLSLDLSNDRPPSSSVGRFSVYKQIHHQSGRVMLLLAAGTTFYGLLGYSGAATLLESDDAEDDSKSDVLQLGIYACRVWFLCSAVAGVLAARGVLQKHWSSLRIFAIHAVVDTVLSTLIILCFALVALYAPAQLGHTVCEHLSRGDALGIVASPGSGLEICEEKWSYGVAPILFLLSGIALFLRTKTALFIYHYYQHAVAEGRICLESPSATSRLPHEAPSSSHRSSSRTRSSIGRHSRSSSASTVRALPGQPASRIMLLPADYNSAGLRTPSINCIPPSPLLSPNSSVESFETVKAPYHDYSKRRSMSHGSAVDAQSHVVVYAPILMSIDEAQKLGGREAVIASAISSSPASYAGRSSETRHRTTSPPIAGRQDSSERTPTMAPTGAFSSIKGFRDSTEMEELVNPKSL